MGRRSSHTADQLRDLILDAATEIIEQSGLAGLSAREIARRISYSPGTLYNSFEHLDDLILTVEARMLDQLAGQLDQVPPDSDPCERVHRLANAYLEFTQANPKLWNLLFEHHLPAGRGVPAWYQVKLDGLLSRVENALAPLMADDADPVARKRAARVLWAGVHGITSLSTADKLSGITGEAVGPLVEDLVTTYLAGLATRRGSA